MSSTTPVHLNVRLLTALRGKSPMDAYALAKLVDESPMRVGQALHLLETERRVASKDPSGTANDLARQFVFNCDHPPAWYDEPEDKPPFEFEGRWWFVGVEGFTMGQVRGPFADRGAARAAWTQFWEFQDAMNAN